MGPPDIRCLGQWVEGTDLSNVCCNAVLSLACDLAVYLQEMETKQIAPELYPYNSRGPVGSHYLAAKHGVRWGDMVDNPELDI